jgi:hypothetical protein
MASSCSRLRWQRHVTILGFDEAEVECRIEEKRCGPLLRCGCFLRCDRLGVDSALAPRQQANKTIRILLPNAHSDLPSPFIPQLLDPALLSLQLDVTRHRSSFHLYLLLEVQAFASLFIYTLLQHVPVDHFDFGRELFAFRRRAGAHQLARSAQPRRELPPGLYRCQQRDDERGRIRDRYVRSIQL